RGRVAAAARSLPRARESGDRLNLDPALAFKARVLLATDQAADAPKLVGERLGTLRWRLTQTQREVAPPPRARAPPRGGAPPRRGPDPPAPGPPAPPAPPGRGPGRAGAGHHLRPRGRRQRLPGAGQGAAVRPHLTVLRNRRGFLSFPQPGKE